MEQSHPNITLHGSSNNAKALITCPVVKNEHDDILKSVKYCLIDGTYPRFEDKFICEDRIDVSPTDGIGTKLIAICVIDGFETDWDDDDMYTTVDILKILKPKPIQKNISGGIEFRFICDVGIAVAIESESGTTPDISSPLHSEMNNLYTSKTFSAACVNQGLLGPVLEHRFEVPIASMEQSHPNVTLHGSSNNVDALIECPIVKNENDELLGTIIYCQTDGTYPRFEDKFICEDRIDVSPTDGIGTKLIAICIIDGFETDWKDRKLFYVLEVAFIHNPKLKTSNIVGGIQFKFDCEIGVSIAVKADQSLSISSSNHTEMSDLYVSTKYTSACVFQGLLGPVNHYLVEVPTSVSSSTKPILDIRSDSHGLSTLVRGQCSNEGSELYCNVNERPTFDDLYICTNQDVNVTPSKYGVPEGSSVTLYAICVSIGEFVDFSNEDLYSSTEVVDFSSPEVNGGMIQFVDNESKFGIKGISYVSIPIERIDGSDYDVEVTVSIIEESIIHGNEDQVFASNFTLLNDGICHWNHGEQGIQFVNLKLADGLILIDSCQLSLHLDSTNNEFVPLASRAGSLTNIILESNYTPFPPSNIIMEDVEINDGTLSGSYVASFIGIDANIADIEFEYCLLSTANDKFLLSPFEENSFNTTIPREELSYCMNGEEAYLYTNPNENVGAGKYDIEVQICDSHRLCYGKSFEIEVDLLPAVTPTDVIVSTCGKKVSTHWSMSRSASFVTEYQFELVSNQPHSPQCSDIKPYVSQQPGKAPGLATEFLEKLCNKFKLSIIACNRSGCSEPSEAIDVEISDGSCHQMSLISHDTGESVHSWLEAPLLVVGEDILDINIQLPLSPALNETVVVLCSSDSDFVNVEPEITEFTWSSYSEDGEIVSIVVLDDFDHSNGPWTNHEVVCRSYSETNDGISGVYSGVESSVSIPIRNHNLIRPRMSQIYQEMPNGDLLKTVEGDIFDLPVSGAMNITIECREDVPGQHIFPNTKISVGGIDCKVNYISHDGKVIEFETPSFEEMCGNSTDCGYQQFTIVNPDFAQDGSIVQDVSCPSLCPKDGRGIFYTKTCVGFRKSDSKCMTEEYASQCAFGAGDECKACPAGAFCPGGYRAWTRPGYWTESESSGNTVRCQPPAIERCPGWNATTGQSQCADGFLQSSFGCLNCKSGYFQNTNKLCDKCPVTKNSFEKYMPFVYMFLGAVILFMITLLAIWILVKWKGGRFGEGVKRSKDFVLFSVVLLQVFISIGQFAQSGLPPFLSNMYAILGTLNLDSPLLSTECMSSNPFTQSIVRLSLSLSIVIFVSLLSFGSRIFGAKFAKKVGIWRRWSMLWLALLYPIACSESMKMIMFTTEYEDIRLRSNPSFEYFGDEHSTAGILGIMVFIGHCIGFPLTSFVVVTRILKKYETSKDMMVKQNRHMEYFIGGTYEYHYFWFRHMTFGFLFITSCCSVYFNEATIWDNAAKLLIETLALVLMCVLLWSLKPYREVKRWMMPVRIYSLLLCILAMLVNVSCFMVDMSNRWIQLRDVLCTCLAIGSIILFILLIYFFCSYISSSVIDTSLKKRKTVNLKIDLTANGHSNPMFVTNPLQLSSVPSDPSNSTSSHMKSDPINGNWTTNNLQSVLKARASSASSKVISPLPLRHKSPRFNNHDSMISNNNNKKKIMVGGVTSPSPFGRRIGKDGAICRVKRHRESVVMRRVEKKRVSQRIFEEIRVERSSRRIEVPIPDRNDAKECSKKEDRPKSQIFHGGIFNVVEL
eukprot:TRINITY_DN1804_c0_g4_i1.p1 TRINITY_DN1804_c0_g4~~TRINITY_DN1804_c0_g4_i1.p1  ORF type:complete len:1750 (-),score=408.74 TRINITY_DN1804_c0_g4_i1:1041-6290(-)